MSMQLVRDNTLSSKAGAGTRAENASRTIARLGGYMAIGGCLTMIVGAVLWGSSGTDLWLALATDEMPAYLAAVAGVQKQLIANLTIWIVGVLMLGVAGSLLTALCQRRWAIGQIARACFHTAVPLAILAYLAMLALVVQLGGAGSATIVSLAEVVGWFGARADDLATALMIGFGPLFISLAGHGEWVPSWLQRWGFLAGAVGLFSLAILYFPELSSFSFAILPIGMGWMIAAGIVLLRQDHTAH